MVRERLADRNHVFRACEGLEHYVLRSAGDRIGLEGQLPKTQNFLVCFVLSLIHSFPQFSAVAVLQPKRNACCLMAANGREHPI